MILSVIDYSYHDHALMTRSSMHFFLSDDNWVYNFRVIQMMIKTQDQYINYTFLLRSMIFRSTTNELIIAYDIETVWIWMKHENVFIKKIYYTLKAVINLFCSLNLLISDYWIELQQDYTIKITEHSTDNLTGFITLLNQLYVIHI